ncbi:3-phytase [Colletotrichum spinosum]|uniref:3-phytase n=1 Tax=Colletotrichum spinosum TaxID=1347390 RepID=A0A4R8PZR9_9PEZI|nr:3-phytase [Colletotrichum spinosum]
MGLGYLSLAAALVAVATHPWPASAATAAAAVDVDVNIAALTGGQLESDSTDVYYSKSKPLLLGNDGGAATGGFHAWDLDSDAPLAAVANRTTGRTKLVATLYNVAGRDLAVTVAMPDSVVRVFEVPSFAEIASAQETALGDWSALCSWRSRSANHYVFLFGKAQVVQYLVRKGKADIELVQVQTFPAPAEFSGCAVSAAQSRMMLSADDDRGVYAFNLTESTAAPEVVKMGEAAADVTGVAVYSLNTTDLDYLLVAQESAVAVYRSSFFELVGSLRLTGLEKVQVQGLSVYQAATARYPAGALAFAVEADDVSGFGLVSLDDALGRLGITTFTEYDPHSTNVDDDSDSDSDSDDTNPICATCSGNGFCQAAASGGSVVGGGGPPAGGGGGGGGKGGGCACFAGFTGDRCDAVQCTDSCSGHGQCVGAEECKCDAGWGGLRCSFVVVRPAYETDANGGDGDDPAIWISPGAPELSRVLTTTKSADGAGLAVFDLKGKLLQTMPAGEPNNVDVIYGFEVGGRKVDLAFAACRADDTLCLFEISSNGTLLNITGGVQPTVADFSVYGSCAYRSPRSGKQYLFVNEKSSRYLQYELTAAAAAADDDDGSLRTTLVRDFRAGSGGQVEGCVADEANGWLFLGEEPSALWRYDAEPDSATAPGLRVAHVGDGRLHADVEGVALVYGTKPELGFVLVSTQGVSAYNVYRRAPPHEYVATFTVGASEDGRVDAVSNTDGIAAVGRSLGRDYVHGLFVTHDDANQLPDGGTSAEASFKLVSLEKILGAEQLRELNLLDDVDANWDPRRQSGK